MDKWALDACRKWEVSAEHKIWALAFRNCISELIDLAGILFLFPPSLGISAGHISRLPPSLSRATIRWRHSSTSWQQKTWEDIKQWQNQTAPRLLCWSFSGHLCRGQALEKVVVRFFNPLHQPFRVPAAGVDPHWGLWRHFRFCRTLHRRVKFSLNDLKLRSSTRVN